MCVVDTAEHQSQRRSSSTTNSLKIYNPKRLQPSNRKNRSNFIVEVVRFRCGLLVVDRNYSDFMGPGLVVDVDAVLWSVFSAVFRGVSFADSLLGSDGV